MQSQVSVAGPQTVFPEAHGMARQFLIVSTNVLCIAQHYIGENDVQNKPRPWRHAALACNFLLTPVLSKTLGVIKLILGGRKLPSLIRKL